MSDTDRGAYTPPTADAPLAFDARQPVRGSRPIPMTLILSGVVLLILVAAIVFFYRSGVRKEGEAPQAVGAPVGALTAPAPAAEQPKDPAAGLQIYQSETAAKGSTAAPTFTPPPEQPAPRAVAPPTPAKTVELKPAQPAPVPPKAEAPKPVPAKPAAPAPAAPKPEAAAPKPAAPKPATPPAEAKPAAPKPAANAAGVAGVQIGAFSSKAQADEGWDAAARIAPGAIAGKGKTIVPVQVNGSTLYRTTVTGFASRAEAKAFCDALKAAGKNCFVK
ncbi:SPOR domain-containing protein [Phenylobacterium sp.]|uniref:cell division protein FtsN n=1 Tax=Phenylobacterium sp. TaxID=1871053 RepID=UPI0035B4F2E5